MIWKDGISLVSDSYKLTKLFPKSEMFSLTSQMNRCAISIPSNISEGTAKSSDKHFKIQDISVRSAGYGIPGITIDGNDVIAVYEAASEAIKRAREGSGPTLIEYKTYRMKGHFEGDHRLYQPKDEVEKWRKKDPVTRYTNMLTSENIFTSDEIEKIDQRRTHFALCLGDRHRHRSVHKNIDPWGNLLPVKFQTEPVGARVCFPVHTQWLCCRQ